MGTCLNLHHVGEVILAGLLRAIGDRGPIDVRCVLHGDCTVGSVVSAAGIAPPFTYAVNAALAPTEVGGTKFLFDGAHGVDVLLTGTTMRGMAIEAKLGLDRMSPSEFSKRFLGSTAVTGHVPQRIKGSMVAILNYRSLDFASMPLRTANPSVDLVQPWLLVLRRAVWEKWNAGGNQRPSLSEDAHVILFEDLVLLHGDSVAFDQLVRQVVGAEFFHTWGLGK